MKSPTRPVLRGLNTKTPPVLLGRDESPDLLNVVMADGTVRKRGGFTSLFRDSLPGDAIANKVQDRGGAILASATDLINDQFLTSPGWLVAGHRECYGATAPGFHVSVRVKIGRLFSSQGGNNAPPGGGLGPPYTIRVLPIISKGPAKKVTDGTTSWGTAANAGMPFCVYVFNSGTAAVPVWSLRLSAHFKVDGTWTLLTVTSVFAITAGAKVHIIASAYKSGLTATTQIRVGAILGGQPISYLTDTATVVAGATLEIGQNQCPIQVFDCPHAFIETTSVGSAVVRPGLAYAYDPLGGTMYAKLRPEAAVDEIGIWDSDAVTATDLQGSTKFAPQAGDARIIGRLGLWGVRGGSLDFIPEETGRGNHLYLVPRGPVHTDGGREGGNWFFNGSTSFARIALAGNPNWRHRTAALTGAAFADVVRGGYGYGINVEFWPDSIEPYEQVIAEIHGAIRLSLRSDGFLAVVVRDNDGSASPAATLAAMGATYNTAQTLVSYSAVVPGRRYNITALYRSGTNALEIYFDNKLDIQGPALTNPPRADSHPPGGVTIGMGSFARLIQGANPDDAAMANADSLYMDDRTGFVGRIEAFRILVSNDSATALPRHGTQSLSDTIYHPARTYQKARLAAGAPWRWLSSPGSEVPFGAINNREPIYIVANGSILLTSVQEISGQRVADTAESVVAAPPAGDQYWQVKGNLPTGSEASGIFGLEFGTGLPWLNDIGISIYHTIGYYRLSIDDEFDRYPGAYDNGMEYVPNVAPTNPAVTAIYRKHGHTQVSAVSDVCGLLGVLVKHTIEADLAIGAANFLHGNDQAPKLRPYIARSPIALAPQWEPGFSNRDVLSADGGVSLLSSFFSQLHNRQVTVVGSGRSLYWATGAWDEGYLRFRGRPGDCATGRTNLAEDVAIIGTSPKTTTVMFSCWLKPMQLDGRRIIAVGPNINWALYLDHGALTLVGNEVGGNGWRFVEGQIPVIPVTDPSRSNSVLVGRWNSLVVVFGETTCSAWVNGDAIQMTQTTTLSAPETSNAYGTAASVASTGGVYIGGLPEPTTVLAVGALRPTITSWDGWIAFVEVGTIQNTDVIRSGGRYCSIPPFGPINVTAKYAWPMNEGSGYLSRNTNPASYAGAAGYDAELAVHDFVTVASGLRQERDLKDKYRAVAFRDRLILTNYYENPYEVIDAGPMARTQVTVQRLGVDAPVVNRITYTAGLGALGAGVPAGTYIVRCTFVTGTGLESDPVDILAYANAADRVTLHFAIEGLPVSIDGSVVARRLYCSAIGGGAPVFHSDTYDNITRSAVVQVYAASGAIPTAGEQLPAPRARFCAVAGSSLVLADLADEESGRNAIAFSSNAEPRQFTIASSAIIVDSIDGDPITGLAHNLGQVFISKRNQVHQLGVGAIIAAIQVDAAIRLVQGSDGIGGGGAAAANLLYGAGDRGVFLFNNTEAMYLSEKIEPTWNGFDRTNPGLHMQAGVFWRRRNQYWISVRVEGAVYNTKVLVFDLGTESWWMFEAPAHKVLTVLRDASGTDIIAMGTDDGRVLTYREDQTIDGTVLDDTSAGACTVQGTGSYSGTDRTVTIPGARFHTVGSGLRGAYVDLVTGGVTYRRRIDSNTAEVLTWTPSIAGATTYTSFIIGAISGYWTGPWVGGVMNQPERIGRIGVEMVPAAGNLQVDVSSVTRGNSTTREWPTDATRYETFQVPQERGYAPTPPLPRSHAQGQYHRVRFGTYGVNDPFALIGYALDVDTLDADGQVGRRS